MEHNVTQLTTEQLLAIKQRDEAASPGQWIFDEEFGRIVDADNEMMIADMPLYGSRNNGRFIAHSREDIPLLLQEIERLQQAIEAAILAERNRCHEIFDYYFRKMDMDGRAEEYILSGKKLGEMEERE
jgi:hypothetical protein